MIRTSNNPNKLQAAHEDLVATVEHLERQVAELTQLVADLRDRAALRDGEVQP